jgi:ABC-type lipoprotein release transport system permease subunit
MGLEIDNDLLATLLGGKIFHLDIEALLALLSFFTAIIISALSSIYPVEKAVHITPITALRQA